MTSSLGGPAGTVPRFSALVGRHARCLVLTAQVAVIIASLLALWLWVPDTIDKWDEDRASDFPNFNGAALLVREGFGDRLYDQSPERDDELLDYCGLHERLRDAPLTFTGPHDACRALEGNFRSPPSLILFYLPGSFLPGEGPYHVTFVVLCLASLALAAWAASSFQSWPARVAVFLAILALPILQLAVRLSQPSALYGLALLGGFFFQSRKMPLPAAACFTLVSLKPQFLVLPLAYLAYRGSWRTVLCTVAFSLVLFIAGAGLVGFNALVNYVELNLDLLRDGPHPLQEAWMYNWQGFALALTGEPQRTAAALLSLSTLLLLAVACLRRPQASATLAVAGSLLAVPYVLFYDWVILAAVVVIAAAYLGPGAGRTWLGVLMLLVWGAIWSTQQNLPVFGTGSSSLPDGVVYWSTLSLALAITLGAIVFEAFGYEADSDGEQNRRLIGSAVDRQSGETSPG